MKNEDIRLQSAYIVTLNNVAITHHAFIGLCKYLWKAIKSRDKYPYRYMNLPDYDLSNFKMKITTGAECGESEDKCDITHIKLYVLNTFSDKLGKWVPYADFELTTILPYDDGVKQGLFKSYLMWGWYDKLAASDKNDSMFAEAIRLSHYFDHCMTEYFQNNLKAVEMPSDCENSECTDNCCCDADNEELRSPCDTCDCFNCPLARDNSTNCPVRGRPCEECNGQNPIGVEHEFECLMLKEYHPIVIRFDRLLNQLIKEYGESKPGKSFKVVTSSNGTNGRIAVTLMFSDTRTAAFSLELHYDRFGNKWEFRLPRTKKIFNTFEYSMPESNFIRKLIAFGEEITGTEYKNFVKKYQ